MKKDLLNQKLKKYSAVSASVLAAATIANAQIVYTDINPDTTLAIGQAYLLNLDGDGIIDFILSDQSQSSGNWTMNVMFGSNAATSVGNVTNAGMGTTGAYLGYASYLATGAPIGSAGNFLVNMGGTAGSIQQNAAFIASIYAGATYGNFAGKTGYIGLRFDIAGINYYGWVRVAATVGPTTLTIMDYAYQSTAATGINAGATGVGIDELGLDNAVTIFANNNNLHVNFTTEVPSNATLELVNLMGQKVLTTSVSDKSTVVDLNEYAGGVYLANIRSGNAVTSKKIYIK